MPRSTSPATAFQVDHVSRSAVSRSKPTASYRGTEREVSRRGSGYASERMARFIVEGGRPLRGEITAAGNKNSALPLIAASLLTSEPVTLRNLPQIRDVRGMLEILCGLGADVQELDAHTIRIVTANVKRTDIDPRLSREIRT